MTDPKGIPPAIYEGFEVLKTIKHTQKSPPVGIYEGFGASNWIKMTPRGNPVALCLGFLKTAPTIERIEQLLLLRKTPFDWCSFEACVKKGHPSDVSNGLGNSKG